MSQLSNSSWASKIPPAPAGSKRQKVWEFIKQKREEYLGGDSDDDGDGFEAVDRHVLLNKPFHGEQLVLYPSYCYASEGKYHVEVRGLLFVDAGMNRRSRVMFSLAKQFAGLGNENLVEESDYEMKQEFEKMEHELSHPMAPKRTSTQMSDMSVSSTSSVSSLQQRESIFHKRFSPFFFKAAPNRQLLVQVGPLKSSSTGEPQLDTFEVVTNSTGRFSIRCEVAYEPYLVHVEASKEVSAIEESILIQEEGVSVISDIDDTIRLTGINGDRRDLLRNVFIKEFSAVTVNGVMDWYQKMAEKGCKFHYVSNAPWGLFSTVSAYLQENGFPAGSIHLKRYSSVWKGLFEPGAEKKRVNLFSILRDFPNRKFILVGDSGEYDLEAYTELACAFPKQILAIYIRDVTMPQSDSQSDLSMANYTLRPDEIDKYNARPPPKTRSLMTQSEPIINLPAVEMARPVPPPPPRRRETTRPSTPPQPLHSESLIDLSEPVIPKKQKPVIPRKPVGLRPQSKSTPALAMTATSTPTVSSSPSPSPSPAPPPVPPQRRSQPTTPTPDSQSTQNSLSAESAVTPRALTPSPPPPPPPPRTQSGASAARAAAVAANRTAPSEQRPPLPARPNPTPYQPAVKARQRRSQSPAPAFGSVSSQIPGEFPDEATLDYNFKIEDWKMRIARARDQLPGTVRLRMWRVGDDIQDESLLVVQAAAPQGRPQEGVLI